MTRLRPSSKDGTVTIADVAEAAGVSPATVSFVLNDTPGQTISPATRERVLEVVRLLRYAPNASARALARGHSNEIAVVGFEARQATTLLDWISALQQRMIELGYSPGVYLYRGASEHAMRSVIESVLERRPLGLISEAPYFTRGDLARAKDMGVRGCLVFGIEPASSESAITGPFEESGQLVGTYFVERGHQRVAVVKPVFLTPTQRADWLRCMKGLESTARRGDATLCELPMDAGLESARAAVEQLLAFPERPTAVFGYMDDYALPLLKALLERGVRVPEDVTIVGMMDTYLSRLVHPALTSVRFDIETMGAHQVDIVDALIHNERPSPELFVSPPPQLIIRESS